MNEQEISNIRALAAGRALPGTDKLRETIEALGLSYATRDGAIRLIDPPELLDAEQVRSGLGDGAEWLDRFDIHFTIDSTNTWQLGRAGQRDFHRSVCLAERQEAGKGRRGRHWVSPFGRNIYMSVGWEIGRQRSVSGLSLAMGIVVAGVLRDAGLDEVGLKWPNDLILNDGKLAGILVEMAAPTADRHRVVIGCGINLRLEPQDTARVDQLCSTVLEHIHVTRNGLVARLLDAMLPALDVFDRRGFAPFAAAWSDYDRYAGARVGIVSGGERVEGVNAGIDDEGNLLLDTAAGRRTFNAGEVSLRPVASAP